MKSGGTRSSACAPLPRPDSPTAATPTIRLAVETKPSLEGFPVVHHAVTSIIDEDTDPNAGFGSFLNEYALGKNGDVFPDGTGREIKAGSNIRFNMHYHANGVETTDRTRVGLQFYPRGVVPERQLISAHVGDDEDLDIPAGESNVRHDGYYRLKKNAHITEQSVAALIRDLKQRGMLDETLVVWAGEMGRTPHTPKVTPTCGRDHHVNGYSIFLAGGGIRRRSQPPGALGDLAAPRDAGVPERRRREDLSRPEPGLPARRPPRRTQAGSAVGSAGRSSIWTEGRARVDLAEP